MAKPSSTYEELKDNIDFACSHVSCDIIRDGCPCSTPYTPINHASVVMNLYYQQMGRNQWNCDFRNSGLIAVTDPSKSFICHSTVYAVHFHILCIIQQFFLFFFSSLVCFILQAMMVVSTSMLRNRSVRV